MSYWNRVDARTAMTVLGLLVGSSVAAGQPAIDHFEKKVRPLADREVHLLSWA